ncbi:MAG: hypothetical protein GPOALKHO_000107 [Sodalis sp.]|nr:MAG: hypothetical protein GPOALKHO_000107 [Sodalis sp.]
MVPSNAARLYRCLPLLTRFYLCMLTDRGGEFTSPCAVYCWRYCSRDLYLF